VRTTVTLDPDVQRLLAEKARRSRESFKQALNNAVRRGLAADTAAAGTTKFPVNARPMRVKAGFDQTRLAEVGDDLELEAFLSLTRKIATQQQP
jgi:hypothetical protein